MCVEQTENNVCDKHNIATANELTGIFLIACSFAPESIHQIPRSHFEKYKISQLLRGRIPRHPCALASKSLLNVKVRCTSL